MKALVTGKLNSAKNVTKDQLGVSTLADAKRLAATKLQDAAVEKGKQIGSNFVQKILSKANRSGLTPAGKDIINQMIACPKVQMLSLKYQRNF